MVPDRRVKFHLRKRNHIIITELLFRQCFPQLGTKLITIRKALQKSLLCCFQNKGEDLEKTKEFVNLGS